MRVLNYSKLPKVFLYECYHLVAEFGEVTVAIYGENRADADTKIKEFCKENFLEDRTFYIKQAYLIPETS